MPERITREFRWHQGYYPTQPSIGGVPGSILDGQNVWIWGAGLLESAAGFAGSGSSGGVAYLQNVGDGHGGITSSGSLIKAFGTYWAAGSGSIIYNGAVLGTSNSVSGTLKVLAAGAWVNAGIAQPAAPTLSDSGTTGKNDGSYSICLTAIRSTTGAESSRSLPSSPIVVAQKKIRITFPTLPDGADTWGIYCSYRNFGATGPWFHLADISAYTGGPPPVLLSTYDVDWYNGELGTEAPTDHNPPPTCTHCFSVNNVMVAAGSYGLSGLSPSIPGKPEAFPPQYTVFIPGGASITSAKGTGFAGTVLVATASSLNAVVATNSQITPITVRQIWPTTGFLNANAWCVVEDEIYGFSGQRGAVRTQGDGAPDTEFARPVQAAFASLGFTGSNTVVGYDPKTNSIMFAKGRTVLCYNRGAGYWHCPMTLGNTESATTGVTVGGSFLLDVGGSVLKSAESGTGTTWYVIPAFDDGGVPEMNKTLVRFRTASDSSMTADVLTNLDTVTSAFNASISAAHSAWNRMKVRNAKSFTVKISGTGAGKSIYEIVMQVVPHPVTK